MSTAHDPLSQPLGDDHGLSAERRSALRQMAPELFAGEDGHLDVDALLAFFDVQGDQPVVESFGLNWVGRSDARRAAGRPASGTLVPEALNDSQNLIIEGDNLEVLRILRKSYSGRIKLVYIDPPYNTGNDFVYPDNYAEPVADYLKRAGAVDDAGIATSANTRADGRFHSKWLTMMYPRLKLAHELLRDDGVIFVSIDDNEVHNLRALMNEVFGEENFQGHIHWRRRHNQPNDPTKLIGLVAEHLLVFSKNSSLLRQIGVGKLSVTGKFTNPDNDARGPWGSKPWKVGSDQSGSKYRIVSPTGIIFDEEWMGDQNNYETLLSDSRIYFPNNGNGSPRKKYYQFERELEGQSANNWWHHEIFGHNQGANMRLTDLLGEKNIFSNPKPLELLLNVIQLGNLQNGDVVLDFFAGSGTTADAVITYNSEFSKSANYILVQFPEPLLPTNSEQKTAADFCDSIGKPRTIAEITKERVRRAAAKIKAENPMFAGDLGFRSFKLAASHIKPLPQRTHADIASASVDMFAERLLPGWTVDGLCTEVLLREGFPLTTSSTVVHGWRVYESPDVGFPLLLNFADPIGSVDALCAHLAAQTGSRGVNKRHGIAVCLDRALSTSERLKLAEYVTLKTI
jgi:adenine-specific DNA-methyltransferase